MNPKQNTYSSMLEVIDDEIEEIIFKFRPKENRSIRLKRIAEDFQTRRHVSDYQIDHLFPREMARKSHPHWTPVEVATRALELLNASDDSNVLDAGSGCGKFCIIAGLFSKGFFTGVEQRKNLVEVARQIANEFQIKNVSFIHGSMFDLDWSNFDCFYFFNPFYENKMDSSFWIDDSIPVKRHLYDSYVHSVEEKLKTTKIGTRVVTYHGYGGYFSSDFTCLINEPASTGSLELWVKIK